MALEISSAETWKDKHIPNKFINFTAFDYSTVKQSLIDYIKLYHPEFNNWIETDELVTILEAFAYISELYSYRLDMVANENLLTTAQRKDSILKLAKFISYNPKRNVNGSGMVKITSIQTSETIFDINGNNLRNVKILWNDPNNINWKSQFFSIINASIKQSFGDVIPQDRVQIFNQIFELYSINNDNIPLNNGVISYSIPVKNKSINMELVSSKLSENGPYEQRPLSFNNAYKQSFNILYASDGLGDASNYTGFFIYTKQGSLQKTPTINFDGITPHQSYSPNASNINNSDVWVNQLNDVPVFWEQIDSDNARNIIFNDNTNKNIFEIETLADDKIKIIFGDGEFSNIPDGVFEFWYRQSEPNPIYIPSSSIDNIQTNIAYHDASGNEQNLIITFSLTNPIQNSSPSEDKEHIKKHAPNVYYTQNRMVNHKDYNKFLLQDNTILKLHSVNRTYAGHSKYTNFNDPSDTYNNINHFGTDLALYINEEIKTINVPYQLAPKSVLINHVQTLLSNPDVIAYKSLYNIQQRRFFTYGQNSELNNIIFNFMGDYYITSDGNPPPPSYPFVIYYEPSSKSFIPSKDTSINWLFYIDYDQKTWTVKYKTIDVIINSKSSKFYQNNTSDTITILNTNVSNYRTKNDSKLLSNDIILNVIKPNNIKTSTISGLGTLDYHSLFVQTLDINNDGIPDLEILYNTLINNIIDYIPDEDFYEQSKYSRLFDHVFDMPFDSDDLYYPTIDLGYKVLTSDIILKGDANNIPVHYDEVNLSSTNIITIQNRYDNISLTFNNNVDIESYFYDGSIMDSNIFNTKKLSLKNILSIYTIIIKFKNGVDTKDIKIIGESLPTILENDLVISDKITIDAKLNTNIKIIIPDFVYFYRSSLSSDYEIVDNKMSEWFEEEKLGLDDAYRTIIRKVGRKDLNFIWKHTAPNDYKINPSTSNIIDCFIITHGYYNNMMDWIRGIIPNKPVQPLPHELRTAYSTLMNHKMISDEMIIRSGDLKILFGKHAEKHLQAKFLVVKSSDTHLTESQIKSYIVEMIYDYFNINDWNYGQTFNFTELSSYIHVKMSGNIDSIVIKPLFVNHKFGELFQIMAMEHEILIPSVSINDIEIVENLFNNVLK